MSLRVPQPRNHVADEPAPRRPAQDRPPDEVLRLQAAAGNRAVGELLARSARAQGPVLQRQLAIGKRNYFLEDAQALGQAHVKKKAEPADNDLVDANGMRWRHLLDPRVERLLKDRQRYVFPTWDALEARLAEHWPNRLDGTIPGVLADTIEAPPGQSPAAHPQARLEGLLKQLREDQEIGPAELFSVPQIDKHWEQAREAKDKQSRQNALAKLWGACGPSTQSLLERLCELGAAPVKIFRRVFDGKYEASLFESILTLPVQHTALLVVREGKLHEFTIEKRADQTSFLHQGYLSGYSSLWWAGTAVDQPPFLSLTGGAKALLDAQRQRFGLGRPIDLRALAGLLREYLLADVHGPESTKVWGKLPFNPGVPDEEKRWGAQYAVASDEEAPEKRPIQLELEVYGLADEAAARQALKAAKKAVPLITLIMEESASWLAGAK